MPKTILLKRYVFCPTLRSCFLIAVIALVSLLTPQILSAQQDEKQQARLLWAIGNQMGSVQCASFHNDADGTMKTLQNIVQLLQSNPCMDAAPWQKLLNRLQSGASPRSLFDEICALASPPLDPGSVGVARFTAHCSDSRPPSTGSTWQECACQWLANTCTGGAITGTTREYCENSGGSYWHTSGHCGKGKCSFSNVCPSPGHYCRKSEIPPVITTGSTWQECACQWLANTCTGGAITGTTRESCENSGGSYWHTSGHCGKGKCSFSNVCPWPGHYCRK